MKIWTRAVVPTLCGGPCKHTLIEIGAPMLVLAVKGFTREFVRCELCAGQAPPDLPAHVVTDHRPPRLETMSRLGLLPLDREPGQEG